MSSTDGGFDFSDLSVAERIALAQSLWESVHEQVQDVSLTPQQAGELDSRLAAEGRGVLSARSWDIVKQRLQQGE